MHLQSLTDTLIRDYACYDGGALAVVADNRTLDIGKSILLSATSLDRGGTTLLVNLDDYTRPLTSLPAAVRGELETVLSGYDPDHSTLLYFFHRSPEEAALATQLRKIGESNGKIGGLPSCTEDFLEAVYHPDHLPGKSQRFGAELHEFLSEEPEILVTCPRGTHLKVTMDPSRFHLINSDGRLVKGFYGNPFPGEVYGHPADAEGPVAITGTYFPLMTSGPFANDYMMLQEAWAEPR